jgi:predicted ester cyclase
MIIEHNTEIIRQLYFEISSRRLMTNTGTRRHSFTQYTASSKPSSLKAFKNFFSVVGDALPDYDLSIDSLTVKGDRVMVRYTISGTHKGDFMGIAPTNERITITGIDIFRLDNGKVVEYWDAAHQVCAFPTVDRGPILPSGT